MVLILPFPHDLQFNSKGAAKLSVDVWDLNGHMEFWRVSGRPQSADTVINPFPRSAAF